MAKIYRTKEETQKVEAAIRAHYAEKGSIYVAKLVGATSKYVQHKASRMGIAVADGRKNRAKTKPVIVSQLHYPEWGYL